jgi:hypothetical protein
MNNLLATSVKVFVAFKKLLWTKGDPMPRIFDPMNGAGLTKLKYA